MEDPQQNKTPCRRSARILLRIPLFISSAGSSEGMEWELVETLVVSQHGAMVRTRQDFPVGITLDIRMRDKNRSARARVVWTSSQRTPKGIDLGFEIIDQTGFWEITFPPDRWSQKTAPRSPTR